VKIGLVGPTYDERSLPFDAQRSINFYPVLDDMGKEVSALYSAPGTLQEWDLSNCQLLYTASNNRVFAICDDVLYELFDKNKIIPDYSVKQYGSEIINFYGICGQFDPGDGLVASGNSYIQDLIDSNVEQINLKSYSIAEDQNGLIICNGVALYSFFFNNPNNIFGKILSTPFDYDPNSGQYGVGRVSFANGFVVASENISRRFWISEQFQASTGFNWNALDFATKESYYDQIKAVKGIGGNIWLFGEESIEIWSLSGDPDFPFSRVSGASIVIGTDAIDTIVDIGGIAMFVGKDALGQGSVYAAAGTSLNTISTKVIDRRLQNVPDIRKLKAYAYRDEGHTFYVITGDGLETALVYDISTKQWHERASFDSCGNFVQSPYQYHTLGFGRHFVGGPGVKIAHLSMDYNDLDGQPLVRERVYTHIANEQNDLRINELRIGIEAGVGLQEGQGSDPKLLFSVSKDGGRVYSDWYEEKFGKVGQYVKDLTYRRLGVSKQFTFKIRVSDPVKVAICGSYIF